MGDHDEGVGLHHWPAPGWHVHYQLRSLHHVVSLTRPSAPQGAEGFSFISINKDHEMNNIKYILVNDGAAEPRFNAALPRFKVQGSLTKVRATKGSMTRFSDQGQSGSEREGLIDELCRLRKQYPKAKILGVSELGERCVQPSERMNQLRRELSDLR